MTNATPARPQTGTYRRLPFAPLERIVRARLTPIASKPGPGGAVQIREASTVRQAEALGVNPRQISRWRQYGVQLIQADRLAVRLGLHPGEIGPEWWSMGL